MAEITIPLYGRFNVYNTPSRLRCRAIHSHERNTQGLSGLKEVSGRFNIIKEDITVIIDYAHTPDGLENLLKAVKALTGEELLRYSDAEEIETR